ncbi:MAG: heparinase II/III family protein [Armatimonadota bacterium]
MIHSELFITASVVGILLLSCASFAADYPLLDHAVDPDAAETYEAGLTEVMAMSEEEMLEYVPEKHFAPYCPCPACEGGLSTSHQMSWSQENPEQLRCPDCGTVVYPSDEYPQTETMSGENSLGETITYKYYLDEETDEKSFFSAHLLKFKREWILQQGVRLGKAYVATGKEDYARRAILILDKIASAYPHYAVTKHGSNQGRYFKFAPSQQAPYQWDEGKWGWHYPASEVPTQVVDMYDMVHDSEQFEVVSQEREYDVRQRLETDFFRDIYAALQAKDEHISNYVAYLGEIAQMGMVMQEPAWVHWAFRWIQENVNSGCFYDGMWHEAPSYHYMTMGGIRRCLAALEGYSDPEGYVDEVDGEHFANLQPREHIPFLDKAMHAPEVVDFPNGCSTPVHDTWANEERSEPRQSTVSTILPGYGHASLGRGHGENQMQAQLHFSGSHGHAHRDNLNLTLWAKEREMLSDIGYTWTKTRWWCSGTFSHNLVAVDEKEQGGHPSDGDLLWFFPASPAPHSPQSVSVVSADGGRGYENIEDLDMYRRTLVTIPVSEEDAYVVDLFRVRGGTIHDWLAHGDADEDMTSTTSLQMTEGAEDLLGDDAPRAYTIFQDMRSARTGDDFSVTFAYEQTPERQVRLHMLNQDTSEVYLGESPSIRRAGRGRAGDNRKIWDFWMPQLVVRRTGERPLQSIFAAVEEPYMESPFIDSIEQVPLHPADENAVALRVTHGDTEDLIISTLDDPGTVRNAGDVTIDGRLGIVRSVRDEVSAMWLFEGTRLTCGDSEILCDTPAHEGIIETAERIPDGDPDNAFVTSADLPDGETLHGTWMIVTHGNGHTHGYEIERVEKRSGKSVIVLTMDHGLRIDGDTTTEVYYPQRDIEGKNTFSIPVATAMVEGE